MSENEKIIRAVEANFALEGMRMSEYEKKTMRKCLSGKTSFDLAVKSIISSCKRS